MSSRKLFPLLKQLSAATTAIHHRHRHHCHRTPQPLLPLPPLLTLSCPHLSCLDSHIIFLIQSSFLEPPSEDSLSSTDYPIHRWLHLHHHSDLTALYQGVLVGRGLEELVLFYISVSLLLWKVLMQTKKKRIFSFFLVFSTLLSTNTAPHQSW